MTGGGMGQVWVEQGSHSRVLSCLQLDTFLAGPAPDVNPGLCSMWESDGLLLLFAFNWEFKMICLFFVQLRLLLKNLLRAFWFFAQHLVGVAVTQKSECADLPPHCHCPAHVCACGFACLSFLMSFYFPHFCMPLFAPSNCLAACVGSGRREAFGNTLHPSGYMPYPLRSQAFTFPCVLCVITVNCQQIWR